MADAIAVPDLKFTGMYYPQVLRTLRQWRRVYAPEITSEDDHEPFEQMLRASSLASHISNVLADQVALESLLRTSKLLSSVRDHLALVDYELKQASPSEVPTLLELSKVFTTRTMIIGPPQQHMTQFSTEQTEVDDEITFEYIDVDEDGYFVERTDQLGSCLCEERTSPEDPTTAAFVDATEEANSGGSESFAPWATPAKNDAVYFGHTDIMFDRLDLTVVTGSSGVQGVWEYYDENYRSVNPEEVTNNGSSLTFKVNPLLGLLDRGGALVRVTYLPTGAYADVYSSFDDPDNLVTADGLLGQTGTPSADPEDYGVGALWSPLPDAVDGTVNLQGSGKVTWTLPQSVVHEWTSGQVSTFTGFMVRFRVVKVTSPTGPVLNAAYLDKGKQYLLITSVQGGTVSDEPLGSSNGLADQEFKLKQQPLLDGTLLVEVNNVLWVQVDNFLVSGPQDLHFRVWFDDDGYVVVRFGDGKHGAIPQMGVSNVAAYYRIGGDQDGNVPVNSLTSNTSGLSYVASVTNPRPGNGWKIADGGDDADLARVKVAGPASLRTLDRAINPGDLEALAVAYKAADNSRPVARCFALEEVYGPKTMEAVVVGQGGNFLASGQIDEFSTYLNGDRTSSPPVRGRILGNHQAVVVNYGRRVVDVTCLVYGGNKTEVENALASLLSPLRLKSDGVSYQWVFGGEVPLSVFIDAVHNTSPTVRKVTLTAPTEDLVLRRRELPWPGTILVTVITE